MIIWGEKKIMQPNFCLSIFHMHIYADLYMVWKKKIYPPPKKNKKKTNKQTNNECP